MRQAKDLLLWFLLVAAIPVVGFGLAVMIVWDGLRGRDWH